MSNPRFYFSFRSSYSWLGYRDLLDRYPDVAAAVEWRPFWEPDADYQQQLAALGDLFPYVNMSRAKSLYILQDVRRLTQRRGLTMSWPVDRNAQWEVAHLAYLAARRAGHGPEFIAAVYQARWERGENISDPATIGALGASLGLDSTLLTGAADDSALREEGLDALRAIVRDGVFGVPFFIIGREKFWGVDRLPDFVDAVRSARLSHAPPDADGPLPSRAADLGHAGGCG